MAMTRTELNNIKKLTKKTHRDESNLFTAEGFKVVEDLIQAGFLPVKLLITEEGLKNPRQIAGEKEVVDERTMKQLSALDTPTPLLAVFNRPLESPAELSEQGISLVLDEVQNPGNLGTIFRTADWFGIGQIFCSPGCADPFGPKAVQAAMGSLGRVATVTMDLKPLLEMAQKAGQPVYGAYLEGRNVYQVPLQNRGFLVLGNEGKGISKALENVITTKLLVPSFGTSGMESLNVAQAAAVLISEFKRRH